MRLLPLMLMVGFVAWSQTAGAQSNNGVTLINNPGGGTIAYAQMPAQHTLQGALGKVLQYAHSRFGARPQISRVMRGSDGNSLAVIFTVKSPAQGNQEIAGLALVAVSASAPGKGAVLTDRADRDDVLPVGVELEVRRGQLLDAVAREGEHLAQVRVPDERDVPDAIHDRQALARLLGREDVLELFEPNRRPVTE